MTHQRRCTHRATYYDDIYLYNKNGNVVLFFRSLISLSLYVLLIASFGLLEQKQVVYYFDWFVQFCKSPFFRLCVCV